MPTTPFASVLLAKNGGAAAAGTQVGVADDVFQCTTSSTVGWKTSNLPTVWQITTYPAGWVADAGWVLNGSTGAYEYFVGGATGMLPPPITMPSAAQISAGMWGKWKIRLLVNGGGGALTDWTAGINVLSDSGQEDIAVSEGAEFDAERRWIGPLQRNMRIWDAAIAGGIGGGVSLGAGTPAVLTAAAGSNGALATAAPYDHRHQVQTAAPVAIGTANSAGASNSLARADHVHDHGAQTDGSHHAVAVAGGANGFLSGADKTKLDGIAAGAQVVNWTNVRAAVNAATSDLPLNGQRISGLADGVGAQDAVTLAQLSAAMNGLDLKVEVRGASLGDQPLSGPLTEDGIAYADGDRYGAKDQTDQTQNGIWVVNTGGAWTRATDADTSAEVTPGMFFFVREGTVNGKTGWALLTPGPITLGVTNLVFTQIFGPGTPVAGAGMTQSGNTLNVVAGHGLQVNANDIDVLYAAGGDLTTVNAGDAASAGVADSAARGDHQHPVSTATAGTAAIGDSAAEGVATSLARSDHTHAFPAPAAPADVTKAAASAGAATTFARADHKHDVSTGTPGAPAVSAAEGSASSLARSDHTHPWGTAGAGLTLNRPQHASGAGIKDAHRGQAAASGAFAGGDLEIGGGDAGNGTVKAGRTIIVLGAAPTGSTSAELDVCVSDGGTTYLKAYYSDTQSRTVVDGDSVPLLNKGARMGGTESHVPYAETPGATVTIASGKSIRRRVTIDQNTTFANPTGFEDGTELILFVWQGGTGSYTASWGGDFTFPTGLSGTLVGTAVDDVDVFRFLLEIDKWVCVAHYSYAG